MNSDLVKGFQDFTGKEAVTRAEVRKILINTFEKFGFEPAETPVVEYKEFVTGDNEKDEAVSDIFKLQDKGKRDLALRYEFTFQLKRLMQNKKLPYKRYQIGEVFRDEPIKGNRFRQFVQCDVDVIGAEVKNEAEVLALTKEVLDRLGIDFVIYFNNRKLLNEILDEFGVKKKEEVIRELDKLDKLSEKEVRENLKEFGADKVLSILKKDISYLKKYKSYSEVLELVKFCKLYGVKVKFAPFLARGLSYYNGSVFEVKTKAMRETITAGGSYMFNNVQATGISFGLDRLAMLAKIDKKDERFLVVSLNEDKKAIEIVQSLRVKGLGASVYFGKPSKALEYANSYDISGVIFVGAKEVKEKKIKIKDMRTGKERLVTLKNITKKNVILKRK